MNFKEALKKGDGRVRLPKWAFPDDYMKFYVIPNTDGHIGPWVKLYSRGQEVIGANTPQIMSTLGINLESEEWEPYTGKLFPEDIEDRTTERETKW